MKSGKVVRFIGETVGLTTEIAIKGSGILLNSVNKKVNKSRDNTIRNKSMHLGDKIGSTIVEASKIAGKSADLLEKNIKNGAKNINENVKKTKTTIYGDSKYFYNEDEFVEGEFDIK